MVASYRELKVYQRAYALCLKVHHASLEWPKYEQYGGIADQYRRCSKSVCANIVEGFGKQSVSKIEFHRFLGIALGSANECVLWTDFARDLGYVDAAMAEVWVAEWEEIGRMVQGLKKE